MLSMLVRLNSHTGLALANAIAKHLINWDIRKKVMSNALGNVSSSDVLVRKLKKNMEMNGANLYYGGKFFVFDVVGML